MIMAFIASPLSPPTHIIQKAIGIFHSYLKMSFVSVIKFVAKAMEKSANMKYIFSKLEPVILFLQKSLKLLMPI
jgi:hypothetical protein